MNVNLSYGLYLNNCLVNFSVDLTTNIVYYSNLKNALQVQKLKNSEMVRIGAQDRDGGYLMSNDMSDSSKIAYSFGICNDVTWDNSMADLGFSIYMYDHTIDALPEERKEFFFFKEGIAGDKKYDQPLDSLEHYMERNEHKDKKNMILKMDVEGAEWEFLDTVSTDTLKQFDQIVFELHNLVRADSPENLGKKILLLNKLNKTHQLIHLHGNNTGYILKIGNSCFPDVVEVSYVLKDRYQTVECDDIILPTEMDYPNDMGRPDIALGKWNEILQIP